MLIFSGFFAAQTFSQTSTSLDTVFVGDDGNTEDTWGYGAVSYGYYIGKYEVSNSEYSAFLNAVAATDTYGLWHQSMSIERTGSSGDYSYGVVGGQAKHPVVRVSFYGAARFANWLMNGQPTGSQDSNTTEAGFYTFSDATTISSQGTRSASLIDGKNWVAIASEDEWYKAAYYDPTLNSGSGGYYNYPAGSDSPPTMSAPTSDSNSANYGGGENAVGSTTVVGSYSGSPSPYGTFDQGGNILEWTDSIPEESKRAIRGGWYNASQNKPLRSKRRYPTNSAEKQASIGFRISSLTTVNAVPTISDVANQATNEDTATSALAVTLGDEETAVADLTLSAISSAQGLVPDANIVLGGSGASRTVTVTPASNQSGSATITLTVSDGTASSTDTFVLTVNAVNDAPTISDVSSLSTNEDAATSALAVTLGDADADDLTLSASSSAQGLVPDANIVLGGSGASRTVTVTPVSNQNGSATITLTVSDGTASSTDTFVLTVNAVNDAPTISDVSSLSTNEDTATSALAVTLGDADADDLTLSASSSTQGLVPDANIVLGGSGASRTVTVTPASNQSGSATITLTVSDGAASTTDTFVLTVGAVNDAPTISDVSSLSTNEDTATSALAVTLGDAETAVADLTLSASSSAQGLVPDANIVLGGSGASRTVTVTPASNQSGSATITLTVSDGTASSTDTFVLTVDAVNDVPTISDVANQQSNEDTATGELAVTLGDEETAVADLTLSASSSTQGLVPDANIVLGGGGASRTVTVTPASNQNGSATITLTVSDGTASSTDTFVLTVGGVNDVPTISDVANQATNEDTATGELAVTLGDEETAVADLTLSAISSAQGLVPDANIVLGGSGASRTVTVTPVSNQNGSATITLTVSDGTASSTDTFVLTVDAVNDVPTISDVANQATNEDTATSALAVTLGDEETAVADLTLSAISSAQGLVPDANIVLGGSGTSRTVTVTPASNQSGSATITLTVSDGAASTTDTFVLTVDAVNDVPTISDVSSLSTNEDAATSALAVTLGDADADDLTLSASSSSTRGWCRMRTLYWVAVVRVGR